jgi:hypothetical protein
MPQCTPTQHHHKKLKTKYHRTATTTHSLLKETYELPWFSILGHKQCGYTSSGDLPPTITFFLGMFHQIRKKMKYILFVGMSWNNDHCSPV